MVCASGYVGGGAPGSSAAGGSGPGAGLVAPHQGLGLQHPGQQGQQQRPGQHPQSRLSADSNGAPSASELSMRSVQTAHLRYKGAPKQEQ